MKDCRWAPRSGYWLGPRWSARSLVTSTAAEVGYKMGLLEGVDNGIWDGAEVGVLDVV